MAENNEVENEGTGRVEEVVFYSEPRQQDCAYINAKTKVKRQDKEIFFSATINFPGVRKEDDFKGLMSKEELFDWHVNRYGKSVLFPLLEKALVLDTQDIIRTFVKGDRKDELMALGSSYIPGMSRSGRTSVEDAAAITVSNFDSLPISVKNEMAKKQFAVMLQNGQISQEVYNQYMSTVQ
jgi:hypothetical protein